MQREIQKLLSLEGHQAVECLPRKCKDLSSSPRTAKKHLKIVAIQREIQALQNLAIQEGQNQPRVKRLKRVGNPATGDVCRGVGGIPFLSSGG
jgi:hypothetical protein